MADEDTGDSSPRDYPATVQLLIDAGERVRPDFVPTGLDDVDAVLRAHLERRGGLPENSWYLEPAETFSSWCRDRRAG